MTNKQLKKLTRAELIELLIAQMKENEQLKAQLDTVTQQNLARDIRITNAGSIAEAALSLSGIFEAAQNAADQYLENVRTLDTTLAQREEDSRKRCEAMLKETQDECQKIKRESDEYCRAAMESLQRFYDEHTGLREMVLEHVREQQDENEKQTAAI